MLNCFQYFATINNDEMNNLTYNNVMHVNITTGYIPSSGNTWSHGEWILLRLPNCSPWDQHLQQFVSACFHRSWSINGPWYFRFSDSINERMHYNWFIKFLILEIIFPNFSWLWWTHSHTNLWPNSWLLPYDTIP